MARAALTAQQVKAALYQHFTPRWAVLTEVTAATWVQPQDSGVALRFGAERRIDVLLVRSQTGRSVTPGLDMMAIEVKVDRGDFRNDVRRPEKQAAWKRIAQRHAYAAPAGLIRLGELPWDSGLIEVVQVDGRYRVEFVRRAPKIVGHEVERLPWPIIMDGFYRAARAEATLRGLSWRQEAESIEELRAQLELERKQLQLEQARAGRLHEQTELWRARYAVLQPPDCRWCGRALQCSRGWWGGGLWAHRVAGAEDLCRAQRPGGELPRPADPTLDVGADAEVGESAV